MQVVQPLPQDRRRSSEKMAAKAEETITVAQVKEHKSAKSSWIIIHNKVYDVTKFLDEVRWIWDQGWFILKIAL